MKKLWEALKRLWKRPTKPALLIDADPERRKALVKYHLDKKRTSHERD